MVRVTQDLVNQVYPVKITGAVVTLTTLLFIENNMTHTEYNRDIFWLDSTPVGDEPNGENSIYHARMDGSYERIIHPPYIEGRSVVLAGKVYENCYARRFGAFLITASIEAETRWGPGTETVNVKAWVEHDSLYTSGECVWEATDGSKNLHKSWPRMRLALKSSVQRYSVEWPGTIPGAPDAYLLHLLPTRKQWEALSYHAPSSALWGNLCSKAGESHRPLNINSLMYIRDALNLPHFASSLVDNGIQLAEIASRKVANQKFWKDLAKETSSLFLSQYYGTRLTAKDTREIADMIDEYDLYHTTDTIGAQETFEDTLFMCDAEVSRRVTAVVNSVSDRTLKECDSVSEAITNLNNLVKHQSLAMDIAPTYENLWDMVPWSFVVDWLVPIGANFALREERAWLDSYTVHKVAYTETIKYTDDRQGISEDGSVEWSHHLPIYIYRRHMASKFEMPTLDYQANISDHWLEATTLILSNIR